MKAKPIPGEHCFICGDDTAPLVRTPCCKQWVCCDTAYLSYQGGGYCQFEHENSSICHFHHNEKHQGNWQDCEECILFFGNEEFDLMSKNQMNAAHD